MIKIIEPSVRMLTPEAHIAGMAERIKYAGCTCYQSYDDTTKSAENFIAMIIQRGHLSVLEHESLSVSIICDRGVTHELVRHRIAAYSQESTRYCNYAGKPMEFIRPLWCSASIAGDYDLPAYSALTSHINSPQTDDLICDRTWLLQVYEAHMAYEQLIKFGWTPQQARSVLPNSLKTEIVVTANLREWRHIFSLRTAPDAHPQMRQVMEMVRAEFGRALPWLL
jgi:thymidylate synthase (FAD)